ncbi:MAG TPA: molybdate ABC transporter permease subunit [Nitrospiria bacterium]|nr:molybdate ABC transporter permease subunit [Nitrospiria bacterium]
MDWEAILLTTRLALLTSITLLIIGLPIAYWLSFSTWRFKFLVEAIVALPLVLPPTVLGFYILVAMGPKSPIGGLWEGLTGGHLVFSFGGLLVASVLYSLPFAVQSFASAFNSLDRHLIEAAWTLGASRLKTFFTIMIPLSLSGIITGVVLSFAHTMGEFGVVLMVGGNIPGVTRTASIDIYDKVQALDYASAGKTALFLLIVSFATLSIVYGFNKRRIYGWPKR